MNAPKNLEELLKILKVLANPVRLRMLALLQEQPMHIYALAKELGLSYPLAHLYLATLEKHGLVTGEVKIGNGDERERKEYRVRSFQVVLSPEEIAKLVKKKGEKKVG